MFYYVPQSWVTFHTCTNSPYHAGHFFVAWLLTPVTINLQFIVVLTQVGLLQSQQGASGFVLVSPETS